ncbi:RNA polymerase factor sigma-32 [Candidatus Synchoanobacter obligatus]|uniref:RNA polymerase factor sigma-32 n=1 Tax=Candidatus Synchoanobacter obligatus TaxID=2919597 RepID=A0ABT1L5Q3_9GAMM|nr:RNA polymerase factor sigma-32 [Candidatus Synchoanobacter obligatus]MCP8352266.1 RNA polymerase factor sigma-32 [Candidatus Synchoanobacter obligatus]
MSKETLETISGEILPSTKSNKALVPLSTSLVPTASYGDSLDAYLKQIASIPLLSQEDELHYAKLYRENRDRQAAQYLVLSNLRFVVYVAKGFKGYGLPLADMIQEGNLGLMKAVEKFDPDQGVRFISYAVYWIRCDINEYIIKNMRMVRSVTNKKRRKLLFNLGKHMQSGSTFSLSQRQELAKEYGVSVADIDVVEASLANHDASVEFTSAQGVSTVELLPDGKATPEQVFENESRDVQHTTLVTKMLASLNDRQREIIQSRWLSGKKASLESLAEKLGVSMQRVSQIEKQALEKCRTLDIAPEDVMYLGDDVEA